MRTFSDFSTFSWTGCREDQVGKITCATVVVVVQRTGQSGFCISQCVELVFGLLVYYSRGCVFISSRLKKGEHRDCDEQKRNDMMTHKDFSLFTAV
jgi:hypothetical protein